MGESEKNASPIYKFILHIFLTIGSIIALMECKNISPALPLPPKKNHHFKKKKTRKKNITNNNQLNSRLETFKEPN